LKKLVIIIVVVLVASFIVLTYFGLRYSRGVPVVIEEPAKPVVLNVRCLEKEIDLDEDISIPIWETIKPTEVKLMHQVTVLPWPKTHIPGLVVKAFHNKKDIYFYLSWEDSTEDRVMDLEKFTDACAIMFPLGEDIKPHTIMMGFMAKSNIWQWKATQDREYWLKQASVTQLSTDSRPPFEEKEPFVVSRDIPKSAVNDLMAIRVGTVTIKDEQNIQGRGIWDNGRWQVVIKRSIEASNPDEDVVFKLGEKRLCAFAVWNGSQGDRGGRKSISDWVELKLE